jgi:hypothetical protein
MKGKQGWIQYRIFTWCRIITQTRNLHLNLQAIERVYSRMCNTLGTSGVTSDKIQKEITMKRILTIFLALTLAACGALPAPTQQPTSAPPQPTQTAVVVVETVMVTVIPTNVPPEAPSATPVPLPTEPAAATQPPAPTAEVAPPTEASGGPITLDDVLGAGWFVGLTRDRNDFSLRCRSNPEITFSVKPNDPNISNVDFYYRIEDRATGAVFDWQNAGRMIPDASGNFVKVFTGNDVNPNFRKPNAWFDYQFIGSSGSGVVGRSEKIEKQVTYTFDCP